MATHLFLSCVDGWVAKICCCLFAYDPKPTRTIIITNILISHEWWLRRHLLSIYHQALCAISNRELRPKPWTMLTEGPTLPWLHPNSRDYSKINILISQGWWLRRHLLSIYYQVLCAISNRELRPKPRTMLTEGPTLRWLRPNSQCYYNTLHLFWTFMLFAQFQPESWSPSNGRCSLKIITMHWISTFMVSRSIPAAHCLRVAVCGFSLQ